MSVQPIGHKPRATVADDMVTIADMTVTASEVVQSARGFAKRSQQDDVAPHLEMLMEIGAKAAAISSSSLDVEALKHSLDQFTSNVATSAKQSVTDLRVAIDKATNAEDGAISQVVAQALANLTHEVNTIVQGEDAPIRTAIEATVAKVTDKTLGEVQRALSTHTDSVKQVLSTESPTSPFNTLKQELLRSQRETREDLKTQLGDIKTLVEVARQHRATMEKTAIKGLDFEKDVIAALDEIAHGAGDLVEPTGATVGSLPRCKTGDAVVTLAHAITRGQTAKIAVEVKDKTLTADQWRAELEGGRKNREAVAALGIARSCEHMPGGRRVMILDPLHIVVCFDPEVDDPTAVYAVYHLLRTQAAAVILDGSDTEFDAAALQSALTKAMDLLDDFDKIDRSVYSARRNLDDLAKTSGNLRSGLTKRLGEASAILEAAGNGD